MSMLSDFKVGFWERLGCGNGDEWLCFEGWGLVGSRMKARVASVVSEVVVVAAVVKMKDAPLDVTTRQLGVASVVSEVVVVAAVVKMEDAPLDVTTRQLG
nr:hypothetical protein [Tanacetum cinerariifolium]